MNQPRRLLACCLSLVLGTAVAASAATLTVRSTDKGKPISPDLFGIFFEDLNYAADGGLYAELVQNRSFEYDATEQLTWNAFSFWTLEQRGGAKGSVVVKRAAPLNANNLHYVDVTVTEPGEGVGVSNEGYDGIPLKAGEPYTVSLWAHQLFMDEPWGGHNQIEGRPMPIVVRLEDAKGESLGELKYDVVGREWKRFAGTITPSRSEAKARIVVLGKAKGGVAFDEISVLPVHTFHDRPNGLRADLAQAIAELKPKFVRFPGGCLAHGDGLDNVYRWKDTIGPVEQRKGQRNLWGYHQSVGLGYFEFFQFCEDMGAQPLPVLAAGVCCQFADASPWMGQQAMPLEQMDSYIQDVLDLIEWANGPATSTWGAKRAAAGHPAPFGLKYLGIGNEDAITPAFEDRSRRIVEAIHARHPEIVVIGTASANPEGPEFDRAWKVARELKVAMVDEHYYKPPQWFWDNQHRYDNYDRNGPKVYVGEYAAHDTDRRNTLRSALAEAAGCTSFERNGDVVSLSSYAPLLGRRGHSQWNPDMIYFTATEVYRSANYYAQQLFSTNSGDTYLDSTVSGDLPKQFASSVVRDGHSGDLIVKIVNGSDTVVPVTLKLDGLNGGDHRATKTVLTAASPDAVNEDGAAPAVAPRTEQVSVGQSVDLNIAPNSLTVLRVAP